MNKDNLTRGLKILACPMQLKCICCIKAKATYTPLLNSTLKMIKHPLELIHSYLFGYLKKVTPAGNKYFITFIDEHSRVQIHNHTSHEAQK